MKMKKPGYLKKFKFDDFPSECYLKTYLGDRALIVNYNNNYDTVSVWLENGTFISMCHKIDLQASEEEISKAWDLLCDKVGDGKPRVGVDRISGFLVTGVGSRINQLQIGDSPDLLRRNTTPPELEVQRTPFDGCDCDSCREQRERILGEGQIQAAVDAGEQVEYSLPMPFPTRYSWETDELPNQPEPEQPEQDRPMALSEVTRMWDERNLGVLAGGINIRTGDMADEHNK